MGIISGQVSQVDVSSYQRSEGTEENKKQVTYQVHKFILNGQLYTFERSGSAVNIKDGNTINIVVGFGKKVKRLYNVTTGEYSHKSPHSYVLLILATVALSLGLWFFALKDLVNSFVPEHSHYAYVLFSIVLIIQFAVYASEYSLHKRLVEH
ncbi:hypothetical protein [Vibrio nigripulchritudo]|uniref:hypothetical protein n=1 Tax=Vibrio nigripulchritudo TaxID=28173 RepID=UPI0005FA3BE1|nr:hypothetical protein [Vibrio nigripulchritudo]KJY73829.1 hypothetical protein TW74_21210 [Vibrio nigripulchritudo]